MSGSLACLANTAIAGELRQCTRDTGASEMSRLKALTKVSMGRCQGRTCGLAAAEILAHACGEEPASVGYLRGQAPIKPLPFAAMSAAGGEAP